MENISRGLWKQIQVVYISTLLVLELMGVENISRGLWKQIQVGLYLYSAGTGTDGGGEYQ